MFTTTMCKSPSLGVTYWVTEIPGNYKIKQKFNKYYEDRIGNGYIPSNPSTLSDSTLLEWISKGEQVPDIRRESVESIGKSVGAPLFCNCSPYRSSLGTLGLTEGYIGIWGSFIRDGKKVAQATSLSDSWYNLGIKPDGSFKYYYSANPNTGLEDGWSQSNSNLDKVLADGCRDAFGVIAILLDSGNEPSEIVKRMQDKNLLEWTSEDKKTPKLILGHTANMSKYILIATNGYNVEGEPGLTYHEAAKLAKELGCYNAVALDGGGSTEVWNGNEKVNWNIDGNRNNPLDIDRRPTPHIIYFDGTLRQFTKSEEEKITMEQQPKNGIRTELPKNGNGATYNIGKPSSPYEIAYIKNIPNAYNIRTTYLCGDDSSKTLKIYANNDERYCAQMIPGGYFTTGSYGAIGLGKTGVPFDSLYTKRIVYETRMENVKLIDVDRNVGITSNDCAEFVKGLQLTTYKSVDNQLDKCVENQIGLDMRKLQDTEVGKFIAEGQGYNAANYTNVLAAALKVALVKIEELEAKIQG